MKFDADQTWRLAMMERASKRQKISTASKKKSALLDQLSWKEVPFPEQFEDAEGFFGLEEISDVEVKKDAETGAATYTFGKAIGKKAKIAGDLSVQPAIEGIIEEDEWAGIGEDGPQSGPYNAQVQAKATSKSDKKKSSDKKKLKEKKVKKRDQARPSENTYGALDSDLDPDLGAVDVSAWQSLDISEESLSALSRLGFSKPTRIQQEAIPEITQGHNVIGKASTGSGKTLAFAIPILEYYLRTNANSSAADADPKSRDKKSPLALIISPTRELAHQLHAHIDNLCSKTGADAPNIVTLTGGLSIFKQRRRLANAHIVIGTPGRLWEVIGEDAELAKGLRNAKFLVLDEADRLLSDGHFKEVEEILNSLDRDAPQEGMDDTEKKSEDTDTPHIRQTLIFSATFQKDLQRKLAGRSKYHTSESTDPQDAMAQLLQKVNFGRETPKFIDANPESQMASKLSEAMLECAGTDKDLYLYAVLLVKDPKARTLVFVNSISAVRRLVPFLQNLNLPALNLHSQMPQKSRLRSLEKFSSSDAGVILIATDVAARGLDIPSVHLVLHYDVPRTADAYIHRSGRTARASASGSSILLCSPDEAQGVRRLIAKIHARNATAADSAKKRYLDTVPLDSHVLQRLRPRVQISAKLATTALAQEKHRHEDTFLRTAAADLGVDYDSSDFDNTASAGSWAKGAGRKKKDKAAREIGKEEVGVLKAQLKAELAKRVNIGVSEKYLSSGGLDIDALIAGQGRFVGQVHGLDLQIGK